MGKRKSQKLRDDGWLKNILSLATGSVLAQAVIIGVTPVISRLYSPDDFSDLALVMALYSVIGVIASLKFDAAIMLPKSDRESDAIFSFCLFLAVTLAGILLFFSFVVHLFNFEVLERINFLLIYLGIGTAVIFSAYTSCAVRFNRNKNYRALVCLPILQSVTIGCLAILFGLVNYESGLVCAQVVGVSLAGLFALLYSRDGLHRISQRQATEIFCEYKESPKYLFPSTLIDAFSQQLPFLLVLFFFDGMVGGQFSMSWRVMMIPMALVGASVSQIFFQRFSVLSGNPVDQITEILKTWKLLVGVGILPLIISLIFAEELFVFALGQQWTEAGRMAVILAPMFFVRFIASPTSSAFIVLGLQHYTFLFAVVLLILRPTALALGFSGPGLFFGLGLLVVIEMVQVVFYNFILLRELNRLRSESHRS